MSDLETPTSRPPNNEQRPAERSPQTSQKGILQIGTFPCTEGLYHDLASQVGEYRVYQSVEQFLSQPRALQWVQGLMCRISDPIQAQVLDLLPNLQWIANYGAGYNNIDLQAAAQRNIVVTNTPNILGHTVADFTWGLILAVTRHIVPSHQAVIQGHFTGWTPFAQLGIDVHGKTLGILGFGDIGQKVAQRARGFSVDVIYHNRRPVDPALEQDTHSTYVSFPELLAQSDFLSIHCPYTPQTHHLFNGETLSAMKHGAFLINTSRGPVVDEAALVQALQSGHLGGAALDVYEFEPKVHPDLLSLPNVVLTAHIASATLATRQAMGDCVLNNMMAFLHNQPPLTPVPLP